MGSGSRGRIGGDSTNAERQEVRGETPHHKDENFN